MRYRNTIRPFVISFLFAFLSTAAIGQGTAFTYQGKLNDAGSPANGQYDLAFSLYDAAAGGAEVSTSNQLENVQVTVGIFTVQLDFGRSPFVNAGDRFLEIRVRPGASTGPFTTLGPRQAVTNAPYSIKSGSADTANIAANADALGGLSSESYVITTDSRLSDARDPLAGSANYIQNTTDQQPLSSFNISGNGVVGGGLSANSVTSGTQFNIGANRVLAVSGLQLTNTLTGVNSGASLTVGRFNSLYGNGAGLLITTGRNNSFFGSGAGGSTVGGVDELDETVGSNNSFFGRNTGGGNTASNNSFFGSFAGAGNTSGESNSFFGKDAGRTNSTGGSNSFFGKDAGYNNSSGIQNSFFGVSAGILLQTGQGNSAFGYEAGVGNVAGNFNSFFGHTSGRNTTGHANATFGAFAGLGLTTGGSNSIFGSAAGYVLAGGNQNAFFGAGAGDKATGNENVYVGTNSGDNIVAGDANVFIGSQAGRNFISGSGNIAIGTRSANIFGTPSATGSNNIFIGTSNTSTDPAASNSILIGANTFGLASNEIRIGSQVIHTNTFLAGSVHVGTNLHIGGFAGSSKIFWELGNSTANFPLCWTSGPGEIHLCSSSARYKHNISDLSVGLDLIRKIRPVAFEWKANDIPDIGVIAEEVAKIDSRFVAYNTSGEVEGVKYDSISIVMLNAMKEQQVQIEMQQKKIDELTAAVDSLKAFVKNSGVPKRASRRVRVRAR